MALRLTVRFQCPNCQVIVAIDDTERGQPTICGKCNAITVVPESPTAKNAVINDFVIQETLGRGGMGTVYLAHQHSLDRPVALKILMDQFSRNGEFVVDFVREARAAAGLTHPNIVQSYAVGEADGIYYFAMEYVQGKTLKTILSEQTKLPWQQALTIIQQIGEALDFAWKNKQLVHRDIKPDNIMLTNRGVAKLADLGLARAAQETMDDDDEVMGTPQYICPEQLLGQPMDVRGDIYSLGATLFHALTGQFPFDGSSAAEIARKHLNEPVPDPRQYDPAIPPECTYVVRKMMAKKLEDRYEDAEEMVVDIGLILRGQKPVGYPTTASNAKGKTAHGRSTAVLAPLTGPRQQQRPAADSVSPRPVPSRGTGAHRPVAAPSQISSAHHQPVAPAGEKRMNVKRTSKVTLTSKTQNRITGGTSGTYQAPRPAPPKPGGGKGAVIFLLIIVLALAAAITWVVVQIRTYNFPTTADAKRHYLDQVAAKSNPQERSAFVELEPFLDAGRPLELKDAERVFQMTRSFLQTFPDSLFSTYAPPAQDLEQNPIWYAKKFKVPFEAAIFAKNIGRVADSDPDPVKGKRQLAGLVLWNRDGRVTETYVRYLRASDKPDEDQMIKVNQTEYDFTKEKDRTLQELMTEAAKITDEYKAKRAELVRIVDQNEQKWKTECEQARSSMLALTKELKFPEAILDLGNNKAKRSTYTTLVGPPMREFIEKEPREKVNAKIKEFARRFVKFDDSLGHIGEWKRSVTLDALTELFVKYHNEKGMEAEIKGIKEQDPREAKIFAERDTWYRNHEKTIELAKRYNDLVANIGKELPGEFKVVQRAQKPVGRRLERELITQGGYKFPGFEYEAGDQIFADSIQRYDMTMTIWRYNKDMKILPVDTKSVPLLEVLRVGLFEAIAAEAGKVQSITDLPLIRACHEFYVRPDKAASLLTKLPGDENAKFLTEELGTIKL